MRVLREGFAGGRSESTTSPCPAFAIEGSKGDLTGILVYLAPIFKDRGSDGEKVLLFNSSGFGDMATFIIIH